MFRFGPFSKSDFVSVQSALYQFFRAHWLMKLNSESDWQTQLSLSERCSADGQTLAPSLIFQRNIWSLLSQAAGAHVTEYLMNSFSFRQSSSGWHKVSFYPPCLWKWELVVKLGSGDERTAAGRLQITSSDRHIGFSQTSWKREKLYWYWFLENCLQWHQGTSVTFNNQTLKDLCSAARSISKALI